jgi:hypothetical protein
MSERAAFEPGLLLPATLRLVQFVEEETGRPLDIRTDSAIRGRGRAIYVVSDPDPDRHLVLVDPAESKYLDHLIAHEAGHILRFHSAKAGERVVPVLGGEGWSRALRQLLPEIQELVRRGLPETAIGEVYSVWLTGTVAQLSDTPADIRIERWIWNEFPALRDVQSESLKRQIATLHQVASERVRAVTPTSIWRASNAMNYALIRAVSELLHDRRLLGPYAGTWAERVGDELFAQAWHSPDLGLVDDQRLSTEWAERLGFSDWFEWKKLDSLPANFRHAWE